MAPKLSDMKEMFEQLISAETEEEALKAEKSFLDKAKKASQHNITQKNQKCV
jgi:hypothetical protein